MMMVFVPTLSGRLCDALPDATAAAFTFMVAPAKAAVGVTVVAVTPFTTFAVRKPL